MRRLAPIRFSFVREMVFDRAHYSDVIQSGGWRAFAPGGVEGPAVVFRRSAAAKFLVLALLLFAPPIFASQQPDSSASPLVLDRAVAVVNKQVILASDLDDLSLTDLAETLPATWSRLTGADQLREPEEPTTGDPKEDDGYPEANDDAS